MFFVFACLLAYFFPPVYEGTHFHLDLKGNQNDPIFVAPHFDTYLSMFEVVLLKLGQDGAFEANRSWPICRHGA